MLKKIWHDPVWSKVIAGVILSLLAVILSQFFGGWQIIKALFQYFTNIPNWFLTVLFLLSLFMINRAYKKAANARRVLLFVPLHWQRWWHLAKQQDDSFASQISLDVQVTNVSDYPIQIVKVRLIKPKAKLLHASADLPMKGSPYHSNKHPVPPHGTVIASIHLMARGKLAYQGSPIYITLGITDQYAEEYKIKKILIETRDKPCGESFLKSLKILGFRFPIWGHNNAEPQTTIMPWTYNPGGEGIDVCEAILKEEKRNYAACGRIRGGLGSLNVGLQSEPNYGCTQVGKVPEILWRKDQGKHILSPNLDRLLKTYEALSDSDKDNVNQYLLSQLCKESQFADVAYFVFLALHRMGRTIDALKTARGFLAGDKVFGYSNLLGTLSAVVSHEHFDIEPSLYPQVLDVLEDDQEHDFRLKEKINLAKLACIDDGRCPRAIEKT